MGRGLPTGRKGRFLAMGLTLLALATLWLGIAQPLLDRYGERAEMLAQRAALARRMAELAATLPALRQQAEAAASNPAEPVLLDSDTDPVASAALQERLQAMFAAAGAHISSVETLPAEEAGVYRKIRLRLTLTASWPALIALFEEIDGAMPRLLVDDLQLQPALHRIGTAPGSFDAAFVIFAFRRGATPVAVR